MKFKFRIPYDDAEKIAPIFEVFGQQPFTRAKVVATEGLPNIVSGDIVRWEGHGMIERVKYPVSHNPGVWRLTDRTVYALTKKPKVPQEAKV